MVEPPQESIFVSIASYRDNQCQYTIQDLFTKAKHPERVVVGVCFQVSKDDEDSFLLDLSAWSSRIRTYFVHHTEAKGPCYARALIQQELFMDEDYYFQIDSHFRFVQYWDDECVKMLRCCNSTKAILTSYASSYTLPKDYIPGEPDRASLANSMAVTIVCADSFGDQSKDDPFLRIKTRNCRSDFGHTPPPALFWTARFAFSRGSVVHEVPYDPHLDYVFFGEEISMSARLWTSGWDLFNPTKVLAYHLGSRAHRHWFREVQTTAEHVAKEAAGKHRICGMLGTPWPQGQTHAAPAKPYGLGTARTLAEYERFAGVDFKRQILHEKAKTGGLSADLFPPQWAEEEREKIMLDSQLKDVESWAGKGNKAALQKQMLQKSAGAAPKSAGYHGLSAEAERNLARMRIQALRAQLPDGGAEVELELSKIFTSLGQLEKAEGQDGAAAEAVKQGLQHLKAAQERWTLGADALWEGTIILAEISAKLALSQFDQAKPLLRRALPVSVNALRERGRDALHLAHDVVKAVHNAHEQTDDRKNLEAFHQDLKALLQRLRVVLSEDSLEAVPIISADEKPPDVAAVQDVSALLLERVLLVCIATGRQKDMELVKMVFQQFRIARESPNLKKLLAMLQSSGHLLGS